MGRRTLGGLVAMAAALIAVPSASAAPPPIPLPDCPPTTTPAALTPGQDAVGYTVRRGETVETFDVEILDVMEDGVAPGRDLVIAEASGPVIDEAGDDGGGISAGMSGSPVYTLDGELIGAIGYGFSVGPSPIAGITPAPDMLSLLSEPAFARSARDPGHARIALDRRARRAARRAGASASQASAGLARLPLPLSVSGGLASRRIGMLRDAAARRGLPFVITGGASTAAVTPTATVAGGDAFAAAVSFGDATMAATGTTTYVCDGQALAFGHPFLFGGPTLLGATRATVHAIVDDDAFGPYRLASPTEPVGVVDRDRFAAVRSALGAEIPTVAVTQDTTALDTGATRVGGRTDIVSSRGQARELLPDIVLTHAFTNIDTTFDQLGLGSSLVSWTIQGTDDSTGEQFSVTRANRFTSDFDISIDSVFELYDDLFRLESQDLAPLTYETIDLDVDVEGTVREYEIRPVRWSVGSKPFRNLKRVRARPGQRIRARIKLDATDAGPTRTETVKFRAPKRRRDGEITISGGGSGGDEFFDEEELFCALFGECPEGLNAQSLDALLRQIETRPRNDDLLGEARFGRKPKKQRSRQDRVVVGSDTLKVKMRKGGGGIDELFEELFE